MRFLVLTIASEKLRPMWPTMSHWSQESIVPLLCVTEGSNAAITSHDTLRKGAQFNYYYTAIFDEGSFLYMAEKTNKPGLPGIPKTKMLMYPMHPLDRMEISFYTFSVNKRMSGMNLCGNCLLYRSFAPLQTMDKQQPFRTTFLRRKTITKSPVRRNYSPVWWADLWSLRRFLIWEFRDIAWGSNKEGEEGGTEVLVLARDKNEEGTLRLLSQRNFNIDV